MKLPVQTAAQNFPFKDRLIQRAQNPKKESPDGRTDGRLAFPGSLVESRIDSFLFCWGRIPFQSLKKAIKNPESKLRIGGQRNFSSVRAERVRRPVSDGSAR